MLRHVQLFLSSLSSSCFKKIVTFVSAAVSLMILPYIFFMLILSKWAPKQWKQYAHFQSNIIHSKQRPETQFTAGNQWAIFKLIELDLGLPKIIPFEIWKWCNYFHVNPLTWCSFFTFSFFLPLVTIIIIIIILIFVSVYLVGSKKNRACAGDHIWSSKSCYDIFQYFQFPGYP